MTSFSFELMKKYVINGDKRKYEQLEDYTTKVTNGNGADIPKAEIEWIVDITDTAMKKPYYTKFKLIDLCTELQLKKLLTDDQKKKLKEVGHEAVENQWDTSTWIGHFMWICDIYENLDNLKYNPDKFKNYFEYKLENFQLTGGNDYFKGNGKKTCTVLKEKINCQVVGGAYLTNLSQTQTDSFEWGLEEKLSFGGSVEVEAKIPLTGGIKGTLTSSVSLGGHQKWTSTTERLMGTAIHFTPTETGTYRNFMVIWKEECVDLPFTCELKIKGVRKDFLIMSNIIDSYARANGLDQEAKLITAEQGMVTYEIRGILKNASKFDIEKGTMRDDEWEDYEKTLKTK